MNIQQHGIEIVKGLVPQTLIDNVKDELASVSKTIDMYGIRNAEKKFRTIHQIVNSKNIIEKANEILNNKAKIVRVIYFDKTAEKNWLVSWHQDRTVAVNQKHDLAGWKHWTLKDNTYHVQPPLDVLDNMVTFRIHLDASNEDNGCLNVLPRSHQLGILKQDEIDFLIKKEQPFPCVVNAGDTLIMRPHIVHSSNKAKKPEHRRVVHVEFSCFELPENIHWA